MRFAFLARCFYRFGSMRSHFKGLKMNEYAAVENQPENIQTFKNALDALSKTQLDECAPDRTIEIIESLFEADELLNKPHTLLIHQREKLLLALLDAYASIGRVQDCWRVIVRLACLKPYSKEVQQLMGAVARAMRREPSTRLVLLISCKPRLHIAEATKERLQPLLGEKFRILVVLGQRGENMQPTHLEKDHLVVRANDNYESLPSKITEALQFIYHHFGEGTCCFKIDEDLPIANGVQLQRLMNLLCETNLNYSGFAGNNKENCERTWHYGKCEDPVINRKPHSKRFPGVYAYGPFYYLSAKSVAAFAHETLCFPDELQGNLYEDWFVGNTLRMAGIDLSAFSPKEWIDAFGEHWWTVNRYWDGPEYNLYDAFQDKKYLS